MNNILKELKEFVLDKGFSQEDKRLKRTTMSLPGHFIVIPNEVLDKLKEEKPLDKYKDDWKRMYSTFTLAIRTALEDPNSRRLVALNTSKFTKIFPCFIDVQFVMTDRGDFDIYVNFRSSDLDKLKDDCIFFAAIANKFGKSVRIPVTKMVLVFGHVHVEVSENSKETPPTPAPSSNDVVDEDGKVLGQGHPQEDK